LLTLRIHHRRSDNMGKKSRVSNMSATASTQGPSGTPRWAIVVTTLVGVGTLVWAVISHFMPSSDKPSGSITSIGDSNVNSINNSGEINNGAAAQPAQGTRPTQRAQPRQQPPGGTRP